MTLKRFALFLFALIMGGLVSISQASNSLAAMTTDAVGFLQQAVTAFGPVPSHTTQTGVWFPCFTMSGDPPRRVGTSCCCRTITSSHNAPLSLAGPVDMVQKGDIDYGALITHTSPDHTYADSQIVQNCLNVPLSTAQDKALQLSVTTTTNTTITNGVSHTTGDSIQVTLKPEFLGVSFGSAANTFSYSETVSTSTAESKGETNVWNDSETAHIPGPPARSAYIGLLKATLLRGQIPFSVVEILDAPVSDNDRGYHRASDFLSEQQRTVTVTGTMNVPAIVESKVIIDTTAFDTDECPSGAGLVSYSGMNSPALERQTLKVLNGE